MKNNVVGLLLKIKDRPGIYVGKKSLSNLRHFISGYIYALKHENGLDCGEKVYYNFNEWLNKKYNIVNPIFWEHGLTNVSDSDAFDMFYEELDEYLKTIDNGFEEFTDEVK